MERTSMRVTKTEAKKLLMPYADGELSPAETQAFEEALAADPALATELDELRLIGALARQAFEAPVADVRLDGVHGAVMARIAAEAKAPEAVADRAAPIAPTPGLWQRVTTWLGELVRFERPLALAGIAAAVAAVVVGVSMSGGSSSAPAPGAPSNDLAGTVTQPQGARRGPEGEHKANGRSTAYVESWEVARGKVIIDVNQDDPDQPMVLWHVIEDEGTVAPTGGTPRGL